MRNFKLRMQNQCKSIKFNSTFLYKTLKNETLYYFVSVHNLVLYEIYYLELFHFQYELISMT